MLIGATALIGAGLSGCGGEDTEPDRPARSTERPLQPLIYTERPDLSSEAAAVRERRLMRQLLEGSNASGSWGSLEVDQSEEYAPVRSADELGQAMFEALVDRDEGQWDRLFVAPDAYAQMVRVEADEARKFVDGLQAKSRQTWQNFEPGRPSEAPEGGLESMLEFHALELGEGRTLGGGRADDDEPVAQYWGNELVLRLSGTDVFFGLRIPKILRVSHARRGPQVAALGLAAAVQMSSKLEVYLSAGLHLKPQLLEAHEYAYPLAVGNFWRYSRRAADSGENPEDNDETDRSDEADPSDETDRSDEVEKAPGIRATETLLEVTGVDDFGPLRMVTLRRSYNDEAMTTIEQHWLVMARRIYRCSRTCRDNIEDFGWLLGYLARQTPIYRFPMSLDEAWGVGGEPTGDSPVFQVDADWHDVQVRAGNFSNTVAVDGAAALEAMDPYHRARSQRRFFAHGRGLVRRELGARGAREGAAVVEELVESRIMPR
ncbi:MAG: hypothetical protein ACOC9W_00060 [Persicimonas sp.]